MAPECGICHENESKYKCPICALRYCSLPCYKAHRPTHETETNETGTTQTSRPIRDRPGTTQRIPQIDFTGFENDKEFQRLLVRFPLLKIQLQAIYGLTLEPGPDEARSWNRQPLPGFSAPSARSRGGRGRGRGRGDFGHRGARHASGSLTQEREHGAWTQAKGDKEALSVIKKMRKGGDGNGNGELDEGMREFIVLCRMRFGEDSEIG